VEQWEPLWDDIAHLADRVLATERGKPVAGHFLGTVVLEQAMVATGMIGCREIIDGQQRLTTLQILVKAAEHVLVEAQARVLGAKDEAAAKDASVAARQVAILTANTAYADDEERYKVWPTNADRPAFREVMDAPDPSAMLNGTSRMSQAYRFFLSSIRGWLGEGDLRDAQRAWNPAATGGPDQELAAVGGFTAEHRSPGCPLSGIWQPFDLNHDYWRTNVGTGHAARPRVDTFLQNWLTRRTRKEIAAKHLYQQFLGHVAPRQATSGKPDGSNVPSVMSDINQDGLCYREIEKPTGSSRFHTFLSRLPAIGIVVFHPVLLALMRRPGSNGEDLDAAAVTLESYLVRRIVCWEQTRAYNHGGSEHVRAAEPRRPEHLRRDVPALVERIVAVVEGVRVGDYVVLGQSSLALKAATLSSF
jgi:hypothetical protein